ncbi:putative protein TRIGALACTOSYLDIACYLGLYCEROL 4 [Helianthus debilis subsp. tardiflorus]
MNLRWIGFDDRNISRIRWVGLLGQIRPINLLSSVKAEVLKAESPEHGFTSAFKKLIDKSFYAVGLCSRHDLGASTSIYLTAEKDGQSKKRTKGAFFQKASVLLPNHDITLEAAWPELFVDRNSRYWELPDSISFDCLSLVSDSGLRYRFGIQNNGGSAKAVDFVDGQPPASLNPGVCAKAAFSYEKSKDLWRIPETKEDLALAKGESGEFRNTAYDISMKDPHATISGIFGKFLDSSKLIL